MASDKFIMSSRQAAELDHSFERNNWTAADVKLLSTGDILAKILPYLRGTAEINIVRHLIDLDADPFVPDGWKVEEHLKGGQFEWDPAKIALYLDKEQKDGGSIVGDKLRKKLKGKPIFNANLLDWLLAHPDLIPEEWKGRAVFFWGTIYRYSDGRLVVRFLYWRGSQWRWSYYWLDDDWDVSHPAAVPASN